MLDHEGEVDESRRNVLTFYGLGGVGKSALSRRLESWVLDGLPADDHWGVAPVAAALPRRASTSTGRPVRWMSYLHC